MAGNAKRRSIIILGAAGRDFHNFNMLFRNDPSVHVVAFTAAQIPGIAGRRYPAALAGPLYPDGIPIEDEARLEEICHASSATDVMFAYSDVTHEQVMHLASRALAAGADVRLAGPARTMIRARVPVIAVSAVRTGAGKSQTTRHLSRHLRGRGITVAVLRHPMPYGDLAAQAVQRLASRADLDRAQCTIEEREEYEPHIDAGTVVFTGVDYARITAAAESEADLILWDGGNNDWPFLAPDLHVALVDTLRPADSTRYHPGETVLRMADIVVLAKTDAATPAAIDQALAAVQAANPRASIVRAASPVRLDDPGQVAGRAVLVVEDGPTITHGGMAHGAGFVAARSCPGTRIIDPRPFAVGSIAEAFRRYPHIGPVLPALGYGGAQLGDLMRTINAATAEAVVAATPADLAALGPINKPVIRARYDYADAGSPGLAALVDAFLVDAVLAGRHP